MTDDRTGSGSSEAGGPRDEEGSPAGPISKPPWQEIVTDLAVASHESAAEITANLDRLHSDFANFHEGYVRHYIALADTKATVVFGLASSVIAFLFARQGFHDLLFDPACTRQTALAYVVALLLLAGAGCAALTIAPRLPNTGEGLVFFGAVRRHTDGYAYASAIGREDEAGLALARLRHCYDVSTVCWRKYISLRRALWLTVIGIAAALPLLA